MKKLKTYARLVRFSHTVFALPFALVAYTFALTSTGTPFSLKTLLLILAAMVFARNAAMAFNRWADRWIDAANPRTASREIPSGLVTPGNALWFTAANSLLFIVSTAFINRLTLILSPVALFVLLGYSYTKRFTAWSHIVLGMALGIAPVGAHIAVTGTIALAPIILSALVLTWVAGFDILYARADAGFDRTHGLHSVPARFGPRTAHTISILLHLVTAYSVAMFGLYTGRTTLYWIGAALFVALLALQHISFCHFERGSQGRRGTISSTRAGLSAKGRRRLAEGGNLPYIFSWDNLNGAASLVFATFTIIDLL